jgi:hypothetical protein
METARALMENARLRAAAIVAAGTIALMGTGCTNPGESEPVRPPASTYEASPGAEALPAVAEYVFKGRGAADDDKINPYGLRFDPNRSKEDYDWTVNPRQPQEEENEALPGGASAPILDIKLRPDGTLGFEDHTPQNSQPSPDEAKLLEAVNDNKVLVEAAMQAGTLDGIYFRLPDADSDLAKDSPFGTMMFISRDYTNGKHGERSIYYYLPQGAINAEAVSLITGHEAAHAALGHGQFEAPKLPKEKETFAAACDTIRNNTLQEAAEGNERVVSDLERMKKYYSPKSSAPAYDAVITALRNGTYNTLPSYPDAADQATTVQECILQNPWQAVLQQARARNIDAGQLAEKVLSEDSEDLASGIVQRWNEALMDTSVQRALSEGSYLAGAEEYGLGGSYENQEELTAIVLNLALRVPEKFGANIGKLPPDQKAAILAVLRANREKVKACQPASAKFHKYVDDQYGKLLTAARQ